MKKITLFFLSTALALGSFAQQTVKLNIQHNLGTQSFAFNQVTSASMGNDFKVTRLQYYLSGFEIIHDGGQSILASSVYYLADASQPTSIDLGSHSGITTIEAIKFSVGVNTPQNNADPSLWPSTHALSPKSPSMHWGWASGYFFVALEGTSGAAFDKTVEMHALGNANYMSQTITTGATLTNNEHIINIKADYSQSLKGLDLSDGATLHGSGGVNAIMMSNFGNDVFSAIPTQTNALSVKETGATSDFFSIYPNPSSGAVIIDTKNLTGSNATAKVTDISGRLVQTTAVLANTKTEIKIATQGVYFISLLVDGKLSATQKVVIQ